MNCSLQVIVNGRELRKVEKNGKTYVVVPDACIAQRQSFSLRINTANRGRTEAVVSVDGLDVISGKPASCQSRGYVFRDDLELKGWRTDTQAVAAFEFTARAASYAAAMTEGTPQVGVIGVVLYSEVQPVYHTCESESFTLGATRGGAEKGIGHDAGTGFGDRIQSRVSETNFAREAEIARVVVEYASESSLRKAGILPEESPLGSVNPWPADQRDERFCQPPTTR
jgi:hypothetical protein